MRIVAFARAQLTGFRRSYAPVTSADLELVDAQLSVARNAFSSTAFVMPVAAILLALANTRWVAAPKLVAWTLLVAAVCGITEYAQRLFFRRFKPTPELIRARSRLQLLASLAVNTAWSTMALFLWAPGALDNHLLIVLVLACTLSGWASMGAYHLATIYVTFPMFLAAMILPPLASGDMLDLVLAGLCTGFWILMGTQAFANYHMRSKMFALENERAELIANLKAAKESSDAARQRAEAASRAKSAFLANMSHELRTPLNAILGFSELLHSQAMGISTDQYAQYGGFIHDSGQHLLALINDILDLAKIETGRLVLRDETVDLSRVMDDTKELLAPNARQSGVSLSIDAASGWTLVQADERAMRQIIVNLASNALKFTPSGGSVVLFATPHPEGLIFGVRDTGIGIAPEDHARVFESFGQGRHDRAASDRGTGLGLPIVKGLAEAHGGRVMLESTPGEGTCVTVLLPVNRIRALTSNAYRAVA